MPKKFYSQTPVVPAKAIAGTNPIPGPELGSEASPLVPHKPGHLLGLGGLSHPIPHKTVKGAHGYGHLGAAKSGHLRLSGHTGAHQLGKRGR